MSTSAETIRAQLESLGYQVSTSNGPSRPNKPMVELITFDYEIETGSLKGKLVTIGIYPQDGNFPEHPPHWVHVTPPIDDGRGGVTQNYRDSRDREWLIMSRPPEDIWDQLPEKHMRYYIGEHLGRIWGSL